MTPRMCLATVSLFLGCSEYSPAVPQANDPEQSAQATGGATTSTAVSNEKTVEDTRAYLQEQIDRYLGGQRTPLQAFKVIPIECNMLKYEDISIVNIVPVYTESGEKVANSFNATVNVTGIDLGPTTGSRPRVTKLGTLLIQYGEDGKPLAESLK